MICLLRYAALLRHVHQVFEDEGVRVARNSVIAVKRLIVHYDHEEDHSEKATHQGYEYRMQLQVGNVVKVCDSDADDCAYPDDYPHYR